jgi:hypothetical protein
MKVAITSKFSYSFFANGLNQNIVLLYELLDHCGIDVFLLDFTKEDETFHNHAFLKNKKIKNWWKTQNDKDNYIDMLLCPGITCNEHIYTFFKDKNPKFKSIALHYGNNLFSDIHSMFLTENPTFYGAKEDSFTDYVLYSPHYKIAKDYYEFNNKSESQEMPYIWSPKFIEHEAKELNLKPKYRPVVRPNIAVVEPSINMSKTSMIPLLTIMNLLRNKPESFNEAYIFCNKLHKASSQITKHLNQNTILSQHKKRVFFDPRQKFPHILHRDNPIILSHQFYNELNYVYLESLYYNFPLIHNSPPFKSAGYYYNQFNIKEAELCVHTAIEKHNDEMNLQKNKGQELIDLYSPANNEAKILKILESIYND